MLKNTESQRSAKGKIFCFKYGRIFLKSFEIIIDKWTTNTIAAKF